MTNWDTVLRTLGLRSKVSRAARHPSWHRAFVGGDFWKIQHGDVDVHEVEYLCSLAYEFDGPRLAIVKIAAEGCEGQGHTKLLLAELKRLHPEHDDWFISTALTTDGRGFWPAVAPWIKAELDVTLHLP